MTSSIIALGLLAFASATPVPSSSACRAAGFKADGFKLLIKADDPNGPLAPKFDGLYVTGVHFGAGIDLVTPGINGVSGGIFYTNGTEADVKDGKGTVVIGSGPTAQSWVLQGSEYKPDGVKGAFMQYGPGTPGVGVIDDGKGGLQLGPGQWMVCDEHIPYGMPIEQTSAAVPNNCAAVTLVPECAEIDYPTDGASIVKTRCNKA